MNRRDKTPVQQKMKNLKKIAAKEEKKQPQLEKCQEKETKEEEKQTFSFSELGQENDNVKVIFVNTLNNLSKFLNSTKPKVIEQSKLKMIQDLINNCFEHASTSELWNIDYSKRLSYICEVLSRKGKSIKNGNSLREIAQKHIIRFEKQLFDCLQDCEYLDDIMIPQ